MSKKISAIAIAITLVIVFIVGYLSIYTYQEYGFVVFVLVPFLIGFLPPFMVGQFEFIGKGRSLNLGLLTLLLSCSLLLIFALEGLICIVMAFPLIVLLTWFGSYAGYLSLRQKPTKAAHSLLLLLATSMTLTGFDYLSETNPPTPIRTSVIMNAPIGNVWEHVIRFDSISTPVDWIFTTGISSPTNATIEGEGVGAIRYCNFSTGSFVEPITAWNEPTLLQFDVREQASPMNELNPFGAVHPPHLDGYFKSHRGQFELRSIDPSRTEVEGTTWYTVDLSPQVYWSLWTEFIVHRIHRRVLDHIRLEAERGADIGETDQ